MIGWDVPVAPGKTTLTILTFQACQGNNFFGSDVRAIIVVVPEEWREQVERLRQEIDRQIEEWKRQGGQEIEKLEQQLLETLRRELERQTQKWLQEICGSNALLFALLGGLFLTAFVARRS
jgi:hypothetical protein